MLHILGQTLFWGSFLIGVYGWVHHHKNNVTVLDQSLALFFEKANKLITAAPFHPNVPRHSHKVACTAKNLSEIASCLIQ
jgi:hypothetical protein